MWKTFSTEYQCLIAAFNVHLMNSHNIIQYRHLFISHVKEGRECPDDLPFALSVQNTSKAFLQFLDSYDIGQDKHNQQ